MRPVPERPDGRVSAKALLVVLCWAAAAGEAPCVETVGQAATPFLRQGKDFARVSVLPVSPVDEEPSSTWPPTIVATSQDACCDDKAVQLLGLVVLGLTFCSCACLSLYGLWASLKSGAARSATFARSGSRPLAREGDFDGAYQNSLVFKSSVVPMLCNNQQHSRSIGSGTPAARSFNGELGPNRRGASASYGSHAAQSDTGSPRHSELAPSITLWVYQPPEHRNIDFREEPRIESRRMGKQLEPGKVFWVGETVDSEEGVVFLRVVDYNGWVFDRHPGLGVLCRPAPLIVLRIFPEEDKAGFKVSFLWGSPLVTAATSQSAIESGLRSDDLIVRVDGVWVREKAHGTAVFKHAIASARADGRPMELHVYRQEEDGTSKAAGDTEGGDEAVGVNTDDSPRSSMASRDLESDAGRQDDAHSYVT